MRVRFLMLPLAVSVLAACSQDDGVTVNARPPLGGVRFVNAVADGGPVDIRMVDQVEWSASSVTTSANYGLPFRMATHHWPTEAKARHIRVFPTDSSITVTSPSKGTKVEIRSASALDSPLEETKVIGVADLSDGQTQIQLNEHEATGLVDVADATRSVAAAPRQDHRDRPPSTVPRQGAEEHVDGQRQLLLAIALAEEQAPAGDDHLLLGGDQVDVVALDRHPVGHQADRQVRPTRQQLVHEALEVGRQVLDDHERQAAVGGDVVEEPLERLEATRGGADADHVRGFAAGRSHGRRRRGRRREGRGVVGRHGVPLGEC